MPVMEVVSGESSHSQNVMPAVPALLQLPIWKELQDCSSILLAGCGGGYDVYQALPLYFTLRGMGKKVHLGNLTFSPTSTFRSAACPTNGLYLVTSATTFEGDYCPEAHLAQYLKSMHDIDEIVYTIDREGFTIVAAAYQHLVRTLNLDAIILVDGGSDSLMAGDEEEVATIEEDHISMLAVHNIAHELKVGCLIVLGLGVDRYHGCSDASSLRAIAELTAAGGFLGMQMLQLDMAPVRYYKQAVEFADGLCKSNPSIVAASILSSIEGHYGNFHANPRTARSTLYINPMMGGMWFFRLGHVVKRWKPGLEDALRKTRTRLQVSQEIIKYRTNLSLNDGILKVEEFPRTHDFTTVVAPGK